MNRIKDFFYNYFDLLLVLLILLASSFIIYTSLNQLMDIETTNIELSNNDEKVTEKADVTVIVPKDINKEQLAKILKGYSLVKDEKSFIESFDSINKDAKIKPGEYTYHANVTEEEIIKDITE